MLLWFKGVPARATIAIQQTSVIPRKPILSGSKRKMFLCSVWELYEIQTLCQAKGWACSVQSTKMSSFYYCLSQYPSAKNVQLKSRQAHNTLGEQFTDILGSRVIVS